VLAHITLLAGGPASVSCKTLPSGWAAFAYKSERRIEVDNSVCRAVDRFTVDHQLRHTSTDALSSPEDDPAFGLLTLAHEAGHIRHPAWSESRVECFGLEHVARFATALGASRETAAAAVADDRHWITGLPSSYRRRCLSVKVLR
jgi:hypothetical protein